MTASGTAAPVRGRRHPAVLVLLALALLLQLLAGPVAAPDTGAGPGAPAVSAPTSGHHDSCDPGATAALPGQGSCRGGSPRTDPGPVLAALAVAALLAGLGAPVRTANRPGSPRRVQAGRTRLLAVGVTRV